MCSSLELGILSGDPCGYGTKEGQVLDLTDFTSRVGSNRESLEYRSLGDGRTGFNGLYRFPPEAVGTGSLML